MPRKKGEGTAASDRLNIVITEQLKNRFQLLCTMNGIGMSEKASALIEEWTQAEAKRRNLDLDSLLDSGN